MISKDEKNTITAVVGVLALLVVVVGLTLGWPAWVWLPLAILPPVGGVVLAKQIASGRRPEPVPEPIAEPDPPPTPESKQVELSGVSLPSAVPDYRFLVSGSVYWRRNSKSPGREHRNLDSVAKDAIISRAGETLLTAQPHEHSTLAERLNVELGTENLVPSGHVYAWGEGFAVTLPEADRDRLQRLADVRKDVEVWEHERNHERNLREYLGDDVLSSPGSAVVWWLARHYQDKDSGVSAAADNIGPLRDLTTAAQETQIPEQSQPGEWGFASDGRWAVDGEGFSRSVISDGSGGSVQDRIRSLITCIDGIFADRETDERDLFVDRQARLLDTCQKHEAAAALRAHYNVEALGTVANSESASVNGQRDQALYKGP